MGNGERNIMGAGLQLRWIDEPEALQLLRSLFPIPAFAFAANRPTIPRQRGASCARPSLSISRVAATRSEEHTSELQSLMRTSYAAFCLKNKKKQPHLRNV